MSRPGLKEWLSLEELRNRTLESAEKGEDTFATYVFSYLSALLNTDESEFISSPWYEILEAYYLCSLECAPRLDLSVLKTGKSKKDGELPDPWEYGERLWYSWLHTFSKQYGWNIEYIAQLDVDDAFALIQEISLDEQFDKEWWWSLSEVAYEYEKTTKKSRLKPLPRPDWMRRATKTYQKSIESPKQKVSINPAFIPPGVIIYDSPKDTTANTTRDSNSSQDGQELST